MQFGLEAVSFEGSEEVVIIEVFVVVVGDDFVGGTGGINQGIEDIVEEEVDNAF